MSATRACLPAKLKEKSTHLALSLVLLGANRIKQLAAGMWRGLSMEEEEVQPGAF